MKQELPKPTNPHASFYEAIDAWCDGRLLARSGYYAGRGPRPVVANPISLDIFIESLDENCKHF